MRLRSYERFPKSNILVPRGKKAMRNSVEERGIAEAISGYFLLDDGD
jgi:hypothetical protein